MGAYLPWDDAFSQVEFIEHEAVKLFDRRHGQGRWTPGLDIRADVVTGGDNVIDLPGKVCLRWGQPQLSLQMSDDFVLRECVAFNSCCGQSALGEIKQVEFCSCGRTQRNVGDVLALRSGFTQEHPESRGSPTQVELEGYPRMCLFV